MRNMMILTLIGLLFWGCSGGGNKVTVKSRSEQELLANFLDYQKQKDLNGMLGLFYQQDTPQFVIESVRKRSQKNFAFTITSAKIEDIPPDKLAKITAGMPFNGKTLIPNLTPIKQISFQFAQTGQGDEMRAAGGSIMFGKVDNVCYFILSKQQADGPVATATTAAPPQKTP